MKTLSSSVLKNFDEDYLSYYALQIYYVKEDASLDDFPVMGYKHYTSKEISWIKEREATKDED